MPKLILAGLFPHNLKFIKEQETALYWYSKEKATKEINKINKINNFSSISFDYFESLIAICPEIVPKLTKLPEAITEISFNMVELMNLFDLSPPPPQIFFDSIRIRKNIFDNKLIPQMLKNVISLKLITLSAHRLPVNSDKLMAVLDVIPRNVKYLTLRYDSLSLLTGRELAQILNKLDGITHLNLSHNQFGPDHLNLIHGMIGLSALTEGIIGLSPTITHLNLSGNSLGNLSLKELIEMITNIPQTVHSLSLSGNYLGWLGIEGEKQLIRSIPKHITTLNLSNNQLNLTKDKDLVSLSECLSPHIRSLTISEEYRKENTIDDDSFNDLQQKLKHCFQTLEHLDLGSTNVLAPEKAKKLLDSLPATLKTLRYMNVHSNKTKPYFYLPPHINLLDLSGSYIKDLLYEYEIGKNSIEFLAENFKATLPETVTSINLCASDLIMFYPDAIKLFFSSFPKTVTTLNLQGVFDTDILRNGRIRWDYQCELLEYLEELKDSLPYIETVHLGLSDVMVMSREEQMALKAIFPNIKKVMLLDIKGQEISEQRQPLADHYCWRLGNKSAPPSLLTQTTFYIKTNDKFKEQAATLNLSEELPEELQELANNL